MLSRSVVAVWLCCGVLQCGAACCIVLQSVYRMLSRSVVAVWLCCSVLHVLQCAVVCCIVLQCIALRCSVLQCVLQFLLQCGAERPQDVE